MQGGVDIERLTGEFGVALTTGLLGTMAGTGAMKVKFGHD